MTGGRSFQGRGGLGLNKRERGEGEGGETGGATQPVRGSYKSFKGTNLTVVEGNASVYRVYPVYSVTGPFARMPPQRSKLSLMKTTRE